MTRKINFGHTDELFKESQHRTGVSGRIGGAGCPVLPSRKTPQHSKSFLPFGNRIELLIASHNPRAGM